MKRLLKDLTVAIVASVLAAVLLNLMGVKIVLAEISLENVSIELLYDAFPLIIFFGFFWFVFYCRYRLWDQQDKETAEINKLQIKEEAGIKKAELENEKIRLQNEQLALQNRQLELQKKNQQSLPKG